MGYDSVINLYKSSNYYEKTHLPYHFKLYFFSIETILWIFYNDTLQPKSSLSANKLWKIFKKNLLIPLLLSYGHASCALESDC